VESASPVSSRRGSTAPNQHPALRRPGLRRNTAVLLGCVVTHFRPCGPLASELRVPSTQTEHMPFYLRRSRVLTSWVHEAFSPEFSGSGPKAPAHSFPSLLARRVQARSGVGSTMRTRGDSAALAGLVQATRWRIGRRWGRCFDGC
jgi:hypothetical protein